MTEGKGYCASLREVREQRELANFIKNKSTIHVFPELSERDDSFKKLYRGK
jgi:hypothetical protein